MALGTVAAAAVFWMPLSRVVLAAAGVALTLMGYAQRKRQGKPTSGLPVVGLLISWAALIFVVAISDRGAEHVMRHAAGHMWRPPPTSRTPPVM